MIKFSSKGQVRQPVSLATSIVNVAMQVFDVDHLVGDALRIAKYWSTTSRVGYQECYLIFAMYKKPWVWIG
jgi:hypothetical protein